LRQKRQRRCLWELFGGGEGKQMKNICHQQTALSWSDKRLLFLSCHLSPSLTLSISSRRMSHTEIVNLHRASADETNLGNSSQPKNETDAWAKIIMITGTSPLLCRAYDTSPGSAKIVFDVDPVATIQNSHTTETRANVQTTLGSHTDSARSSSTIFVGSHPSWISHARKQQQH
jgi:hypothetical protein